MRKLIVGVAAIATVCVAGFGFLLVFVPRGCGCASPPTLPPWPVSQTAAYDTAQAFTTESITPRPGWSEVANEKLWVFYPGEGGTGTWALVSGTNGHLLALLETGAIPDGPSGAVSADEARSTAKAYLTSHGVIASSAPSVSELRVGEDGIRGYLVRWPEEGGVEIAVSAATGRVFWYADLARTQLQLKPPLVGIAEAQTKAKAIATGATSIPKSGLTMSLSDDGRESAEWWLDLIVADPADTPATRVRLDAFTGAQLDGK